MSTPVTETPIESSETETEKKKMLILRTRDNQEFEVEQSIAIQSGAIKNLVEDDCASTAIPLPNVDSQTLTKVIEYLKAHADSNASKDDLKEFDKNFVLSVSEPEDFGPIFDLVVAANYLDIPGLLEVTCQYVADHIKDKSVEEVREFFNIDTDFTEEEEAAIRRENAWAYE